MAWYRFITGSRSSRNSLTPALARAGGSADADVSRYSGRPPAGLQPPGLGGQLPPQPIRKQTETVAECLRDRRIAILSHGRTEHIAANIDFGVARVVARIE